MSSPSPQNRLINALSLNPSDELVLGRVHEIHHYVLAHSPYIRQPNFTTIHPRDLELLFGAYDERFFSGLCRWILENRKLCFRLSQRMTRAGGTTARFRARNGEESYQIAVATSILFDGFGKNDRRISVCGLECENRLEALQRIFEHEIVHLIELLCWSCSDCTAARFQDIARRFFRVNRITKRATVLVQDTEGARYSDGLRYKTYYVPVSCLEPPVAPTGGE
jgi:hypothetical protein